MSDEELLRALALLLTRHEDTTTREARDTLYELALRIYALLLNFPEPQFDRLMQWREYRARILAFIIAATPTLSASLTAHLLEIEPQLTQLFRNRYGLRPPQLTPRPLTEILNDTRVLTVPLSSLFSPEPYGVSPYAYQLLRLVERSINAAIFANEPTPQLAARILTPPTGAASPPITKGTVANAIVDRHRSIVAAAYWGLVTPRHVSATAQLPTPPTLWRWNAILDPKTCPICAPLHNTTAPTPESFPNGAPPVHPRCRCSVYPVT